MAEEKQATKRQRDFESPVENTQDEKRYKSCHQILSSNILEQEHEEEEVSSQDLSALLTTLQQEFSAPLPGHNPEEAGPYHQTVDSGTSECSPSSNSVVSKEDEEDDEKERMIRHLLQASDDELGIPNRVDSGDEEFNGPLDLLHNPFPLCDGLWELEDEAANYYTLLQAELFM